MTRDKIGKEESTLTELQETQNNPNNENREYKDSVFTDLFYSDEHAQENLLSLCRALLPNMDIQLEDIHKERLDVVLFDRLQNDIACVIGSLVLFMGEHQSTINNNIPLRLLLYVARLYEKLLQNANKFSTKQIPLAKPVFYVFYNGKRSWKKKQLRLSSAFAGQDLLPDADNSLELVVNVINIRYNKGEYNEILEKCPILKEYSQFIDICERHAGEPDRLEQAVKECIKQGILADYLERKSKEVVNMLTIEYDEELAHKVYREEGYEDGLEAGEKRGLRKGRNEGRVKALLELVEEGFLTRQQAIEKSGLSQKNFEKIEKNL